ncbi:hypothetical protein GCM10010172_19770 [Paractinoplanes ferrugineus]|uniref:Uncharacterized protein n=1 Tax=Paractinoplanes ferrugineus TaxID=113564 RepID=A0A919J131_9ACTN|nr:hypothetical protein [Actinoplanes ferrugineus]GIE12080.1 hypothetical protein Afe05nite_39200 [Actinoplanes ferrugineus]
MSRPTPRSGRNRQIAIGAATALVVVVGGGAFLVGSRADDSAPRDADAIGPAATAPAGNVPAPEPQASTPPVSGTRAGAARRTRSPEPAVRTEVDAARSRAAAAGNPVQRPLTPSAQPKIAAAAVDSLVEEERPLPGGGTLRIKSARYDLSGQGELLWAADGGTPAGGALCTQNFRFAQGQKPAVRANMLLCWRTTADRSVTVLAVTPEEVPNSAQVLNVLDTQWDRL